MRYLNRFNESLHADYIDPECIEECFIDMDITLEINGEFGVWSVNVKFPFEKNDDETVNSTIDFYQSKVKLLFDIKNCLDKVKIEYPRLNHKIIDYDEVDNFMLDFFKIRMYLE